MIFAQIKIAKQIRLRFLHMSQLVKLVYELWLTNWGFSLVAPKYGLITRSIGGRHLGKAYYLAIRGWHLGMAFIWLFVGGN